MKLPWSRHPLPDEARAAIGSETVRAWVRAEAPADTLVGGSEAMYAVAPDGILRWRRPWHQVDGGSFDRDTSTLTVTWVDRATPERWRLPLDTTFPEIFRAQVQATVVLAELVDLGDRRHAKVVIRKDLADRLLLVQVVYGRGVDEHDPQVRAEIEAATGRLKEQVGLG